MIFKSPQFFIAAVFPLVFAANQNANAQYFNDIELSPHNYPTAKGKDPMSVLIEKAKNGEHDFGTVTGLPALKKLLADLNIPESSQIIVFSQTSLQRKLVSPQNPRAIYFNEDVDVAWMPGGKIEVTAFDADAGGLFYFENPPKNRGDHVGFERPESCMGCHGGSATNYLPGPLARSNFTADTGRRVRSVQTHERVSHAIPFNERWGGYFVTNAPKSMQHMGNAFAVREDGQIKLDVVSHSEKTDLSEYFKSSKLLRPDSDVVNMMLFDHQIELHNLLIEARYRERITQYRAEKNGGEIPKSTLADTDKFIKKLVRYLLFADEVSLDGHAVKRNIEFEKDFFANKRVDSDGHSLKDFDLNTRLFKNRLSYMIYSQGFANAPQSMKDRVYKQLWEILSKKEAPEGYEYFDDGERERIVSILRATKDDLPDYWKG